MKKLLVNIPALTGDHRTAIEKAAETHGYEALFRESQAQALEAAKYAEIIFSADPALAGVAGSLKWM